MKKPILCVGITPCLQRTLQFTRLELGDVNRARAVTVSAGGKACTMARVLQALGEAPLVTGFLGGDTGQLVATYLRERNIGCNFVASDQPTRVCSTVLDETTGQVTELVEEAALPSPDDWCQFDGKLVALLVECGMVVISGALPPKAPDYVYANIAQKAVTLGVPLLIDSQKIPLTNTLPYQPLMIKLNRRELSDTCQVTIESDDDMIQAARSLVARGAQWALVTQGPRTGWLVSAQELWRCQPPVIQAVNPIGSGDSTAAGVAYALRQGHTMPEATRFGLACGTADALTLVPGDVKREDVQRLLASVKMEKVSG
jgi:1-phosphofructokinase family hexose kinase